MSRILVTAALPYANGPLHLGHLAGAYLPADFFVRYQRMKGQDIAFICGSDGHGVPIMLKARAEGVSPDEIVDRYHKIMGDSFRGLGISFDIYSKTTTPVHRETSQDFFRVLAKKGKFVQKSNQQLFDPEANMFLADRFVKGTCPICGNPDAYGDQCEKCGTALSPDELIDPRSTITHATPVKKETTHWYLPMGTLQPELEAWIATKPHWKKNVLGQVSSWFQTGLADRAMTRDLSWGVPVPKDVADAKQVDAEGKVLYVWFDAPIGYISATKEWAIEQGQPELWKAYWQDSDSRLIHFIGKDNIVFHCLIFPAMLKEHGDFVLPENVPANEFLNLEGQKLSTSRGWAVWLHEFLEVFDADLLRYAMAGIFPETKDADFSWKDFQTRVNSELADVLGNFVNRALTFTKNFYGGTVPELVNPSAMDSEVLAQLADFPARIGQCYEEFRFRDAVFETMNLARMGNKYFADTQPWHLRKTDEQAAGNVIHVALQICATLGVVLEPMIPGAAQKLRTMLNLTGVRSSMPNGEHGLGWDDAARTLLPAGHAVQAPEILFVKLEDAVIQAQIDKLHARAAQIEAEKAATDAPEKPYAPLKETIVYDDFARLDLRAGVVLSAERVPKANKLLLLQVDLGFEKRQILSGIAKYYEPEALVGKNVVVVANLAPRKMRGIESQGMILMAEDRDGNLRLTGADVEPGAPVL